MYRKTIGPLKWGKNIHREQLWFSLLICCLMIFFSVLLRSTPLHADIIYYSGWENGFDDGFIKDSNHSCCSHSLTTGTSFKTETDGKTVVPYEGEKLTRALVRKGDPSVSDHPARAQLHTGPDDTVNGEILVQHRVDRWFGFAVYFPSDNGTVTYETSNGVFDFHGQGGGAGGPPLNLILRGGPGDKYVNGYQMRLQAYDQNGNCGNGDELVKIDVTSMMDEWIEIVLHINFDDRDPDGSGNGVIELWVNGTSYYKGDYQVCHVHYDVGNFYMKIGANVSSTPDYPLENFYDALRVGDENSSYKEVDPAQDGSYPPPAPDPPPASKSFEAEIGVFSGPMEKVSDSDASEGYYIRSTQWGEGKSVYEFTVDSSGLYKMKTRVLAQDGSSNSFFFRVNNHEEKIWGIDTSDKWQVVDISDREADLDGPYIVELTQGVTHTLYLRGRDVDTRLDYIVLEKIGNISLAPPSGFKIVE